MVLVIYMCYSNPHLTCLLLPMFLSYIVALIFQNKKYIYMLAGLQWLACTPYKYLTFLSYHLYFYSLYDARNHKRKMNVRFLKQHCHVQNIKKNEKLLANGLRWVTSILYASRYRLAVKAIYYFILHIFALGHFSCGRQHCRERSTQYINV